MAADEDAVCGSRITQTQAKEGGQAMSQSFRAVKEIWNVHSSCFIEPEKLIALLHDLAARVGTASDEHEYGDNQVVWLENGRKVLDYMEADERFSAASFKDSMEEQGIAVNRRRPAHCDRQYAELVETMAEVHRETRRTRVLHRCLLNPTDVTFHDTSAFVETNPEVCFLFPVIRPRQWQCKAPINS
jgi:hypothetical protein